MPLNPLAYISNNKPAYTPFGQQRTIGEGAGLLQDQWDGAALDTTYRWNPAILGGTGTATVASGSLTLATGTTVSNAAAVSSKVSFFSVGGSFLLIGTTLRMEAAQADGSLIRNTHRFFGQATPNASFTAATPLADAAGFEVDLNGRFNACVYSGNSKVFSQDLTMMASDGVPHTIAVLIRGDVMYFFVDDLNKPVAFTAGFSPSTSQLPMREHVINHTSAPAIAPTWAQGATAAIDTGGNFQSAFNGQIGEAMRSPGKFITLNAVSVATETTIWTPAAGKRFRLMGYVLTSGTVGGNVVLKDNTAGTTIGVIPFGAANATINVTPPALGNGILSAAINNVLTATGTATQTLSGWLIGCEE